MDIQPKEKKARITATITQAMKRQVIEKSVIMAMSEADILKIAVSDYIRNK